MVKRSFAKFHVLDCLHCGDKFGQWGRRGRLRKTCDDDCRIAREHFIRVERRRDWYQQLVRAGAAPATAQSAACSATRFEATLKMLKSGELPKYKPVPAQNRRSRWK